MKIQWYPGHMTKALREMEQNIKLVDLVIYVLDARAPYSCLNPQFNEIVGNKPIIFVLNKTDLADESKTRAWQKFYSGDNQLAITQNSTLSNAGKQIVAGMEKLLANKLERNKQKGITMPLRAMVIGVPNCGKSTLINNLCGKYKAITGDRPSVTRNTQWVKIAGNIELLDTPGTLWPSFDDDSVAHNLAYINAIREDILDVSELSLDFIDKLLQSDYRMQFLDRYGLEFYEEKQPVEYLAEVCEARKFVLRGGELDWERGARAILDDFRKGRLGAITLDEPKERVCE